jgi:hypothetical protein
MADRSQASRDASRTLSDSTAVTGSDEPQATHPTDRDLKRRATSHIETAADTANALAAAADAANQNMLLYDEGDAPPIAPKPVHVRAGSVDFDFAPGSGRADAIGATAAASADGSSGRPRQHALHHEHGRPTPKLRRPMSVLHTARNLPREDESITQLEDDDLLRTPAALGERSLARHPSDAQASAVAASLLAAAMPEDQQSVPAQTAQLLEQQAQDRLRAADSAEEALSPNTRRLAQERAADDLFDRVLARRKNMSGLIADTRVVPRAMVGAGGADVVLRSPNRRPRSRRPSVDLRQSLPVQATAQQAQQRTRTADNTAVERKMSVSQAPQTHPAASDVLLSPLQLGPSVASLVAVPSSAAVGSANAAAAAAAAPAEQPTPVPSAASPAMALNVTQAPPPAAPASVPETAPEDSPDAPFVRVHLE